MTQGHRLLKLGVALIALPLSGCETVGGWADAMGNHMPVVGDRCEHWQCFTSSGQAQSDAIAAQKEKEHKMEEAKEGRGTPLMTSQQAAAQQQLQQQQPQGNASMSNAAQAQYQQYMQQQKQDGLPLYYDYPASSGGGNPPAEPVQQDNGTSQPN